MGNGWVWAVERCWKMCILNGITSWTNFRGFFFPQFPQDIMLIIFFFFIFKKRESYIFYICFDFFGDCGKGGFFWWRFLRFLDFLAFLDFLVFLVYLDFMENLVYPGISCPPAPQKAGFHFALLSPCTIFREDRLRLGRGKNEKRCFSFCSSLALHYLCPHFSYIYIYLRLW